MKNKLLFCCALSAVLASVPSWQATAASVTDGKVRDVAAVAGYELPEWTQRIEFESTITSAEPTWSVLTVQPLWQTADKRSTFFTQLSALSYDQFDDRRTTTNMGLGYRRLVLDDKVLLGLNSFFDREWDYNHDRASVGAEIRSAAFEVNSNYYDAISGRKDISSTLTERALGGWDAEIGAQVPYMPWAKLFAKSYTWNGELGDDKHGRTYSVRLQPASWFEFEAGRDNDGSNGVTGFAKFRLKTAFGDAPKPVQWIDSTPFAINKTMEDKTLEKVRRTNKIVVERTNSAGGAGALTFRVGRGT